jgi:hypothetical protein
MAKANKKIQWKSIPCWKGCGAYWNHYISQHGGGSVCRVYWTRRGLAQWQWAPFDNKPCASFRVVEDEDGNWMKHPTNPAWKDDKAVKRCC